MPDKRSEILEKAPLHYAPTNEFGVVYLFASIAPKFRIRVEEIRAAFPDCIAYQKTGNGEKKIRIEFEFKSRNFKTHKHSPEACDWIVCWEDNWPDCPDNLRIIELKHYFGFGTKIWIQPVISDQTQGLNKNKLTWGLSANSSIGDLLLIYRASPTKAITDIFVRTGELVKEKASWRKGTAYFAEIKRVCKLESPVFWEDLRKDKFIKTAYFVRNNMQGNIDATEYWHFIYEKIIKRNPEINKILERYSPEKL